MSEMQNIYSMLFWVIVSGWNPTEGWNAIEIAFFKYIPMILLDDANFDSKLSDFYAKTVWRVKWDAEKSGTGAKQWVKQQ